MNLKYIFLGGLAAGALLNLLEIAVNSWLLSPHYVRYQDAGYFLREARFPFAPLWVLGLFAIGLILAWLYAVASQYLGRRPTTAAAVGLTVGLVAHVPYNFSLACWSPLGYFVPMTWMVTGVVEYTLATLLIGYIYEETVLA